jgi:hypothetical protein
VVSAAFRSLFFLAINACADVLSFTTIAVPGAFDSGSFGIRDMPGI